MALIFSPKISRIERSNKYILFKQISPNGIFGLVFLHLELEGGREGEEKNEGIASVFFYFDDVQPKYCLHLIQDSNQHANFLTYTHTYISCVIR